METPWDCIVVGGGAAGLSAALVLGRARRRTLVIDAGGQSNVVAHGIGGLLGHDGRPPAELYAAGRNELGAYPTVELRSGEVMGGERRDGDFVLDLADGSREVTRRVLLATGMDYRFPQVPGSPSGGVARCSTARSATAGRCGTSRWACSTGALAARSGRFWSDDVTLLSDGPADLDAVDLERLSAAKVTVDERRVAVLRGPGDTLAVVDFAGGDELPLRGLLVPVTLHQRSGLATQLGATATGPGPVAVDAIEIDPMFHTTVPGVSAAGDVSSQMPSVASAVATGSAAAAMIVHGLMAEAYGLPQL